MRLGVLWLGVGGLWIGQAPAQGVGDPLENVRAYSLEIDSAGLPLPGYFPIGLRGGDPPLQVVRLVTHAGFNLWQDFSIARPGEGAVLEPEKRPEAEKAALFTHGMFGFTQAKDMRPPPPHGMSKLPREAPGYGMITLGVDEKGETGKLDSGSKQAFNIFNPGRRAYHLDSKAATGRLAGAAHALAKPTLFWGMENEWEGMLNYADEAKAAFAVWLEKTYGGKISGLNEAWEGGFKSFAEAAAQPPKIAEYVSHPGAFLDWHDFQTEAFTAFMSEAAHTLHEHDPLRRPVVHKSTQQMIDMPHVSRRRGVFNHERFADQMRDISGGLYGVNVYGSGDREAYEINYIYHCIQPLEGGAFGVMTPEMNNHNGPGYQWGATYWRVLSNGLKASNLFAPGHKGAEEDYATFGHIDAKTGEPRDKMFYAARWAHMIHRTEKLWKEAQPLPDMPRVAILLPRRDLILATPPSRMKSQWAYPENNRSLVFQWLRQAGYWVDVLPYNKLDPGYLGRYQALFMVGAEHLTQGECERLTAYVTQGGTVIADERPGYYDERHRVRHQLDDLFGARFEAWDGKSSYDLGGDYAGVVASGLVPVEVTTGTAVKRSADGRPLVTERKVGKGRVLHLAMKLGSLWSPQDKAVVESGYAPVNPNTADAGEGLVAAAFKESRWLTQQLQRLGIEPAYRLTGKNGLAMQPHVRLEQPWGDDQGNVVLTYSTDAVLRLPGSAITLPETTVEVMLPEGSWSLAVFGRAEDAGLEPIRVERLENGRSSVSLPSIETAGVIYLLKEHPPLLGIPQIQGVERANDGHAAQVDAGQTFMMEVQLATAGQEPLGPGHLEVRALKAWKVQPARMETGTLARGEMRSYRFTVTVPDDGGAARPDLFPLVARWNDGQGDRAICATNVFLKAGAEEE
ncbi:beta-galactosidase-like protein [Prosthecobacter fusiformis]|uniref:beta-galactosidase n=2 Tax=Prosthecobacter fusiformis TaxID=48464 RepID=A0A4R7RIF4_9BACT|nr:beta-galactosidase-like protein [Prosthecobacter fusiformis]